jgi:lipopolysaccharide export system permease protein
MRILFITSNRVGDAVLTTGLLAWLEKQYPEAQFTIACGPYGADLFRGLPRLERLIVMKKKKANGHWLDLWHQTIGIKWDLLVDLRNSIVSRLLFAKKRAIHSRGHGQHKVIDNAAVLGITPPPDPYIWITPEATAQANRLLPSDRPILALAPAANWHAKQWPVENFIALVKSLTAPESVLAHAAIMILCDHHERIQIMPLLNSIPEKNRIEIIGYNLQIVAACLKHARLFVGNDSGLMHVSAAVGAPTLGMFGPGVPLLYRPWGERGAYVTTLENRAELLSHWKVDGQEPNLMQSLSVEHVSEAAQTLLRRT